MNTQNTTTHSVMELVAKLDQNMRIHNETLVTVESCTGGLLGKFITDKPGVSSWYMGGWIVYANYAKETWLSVPKTTIDKFGAASEEVCLFLVENSLLISQASFAISITGIAGPTGGSEHKPIGRVYFAWGHQSGYINTAQQDFPGDREQVRSQAAKYALQKSVDFYVTQSDK